MRARSKGPLVKASRSASSKCAVASSPSGTQRRFDHVWLCALGEKSVADVRARVGDDPKALEGFAPAPSAEVEHREDIGGKRGARGNPVCCGELAQLGASPTSLVVVALDGRDEGEDAERRPRGISGSQLPGKLESLARHERRLVETLRQIVLRRAHGED